MLGVDACEFGGQVLELLWIAMCYRGFISEDEEVPVEGLSYHPPALKSLEELQNLDKDDESLVKYKKFLLGEVPSSKDKDIPNVQVTSMTLVCDEAPAPITMDLTGDLSKLNEKAFTVKEGVQYRLKIKFKVNREIVPGLKYHHVTTRKGVSVDKVSYMVGSYGPRAEEHEYISPLDEAPKGMMSRGHYKIQSRFIDDDKNVCLVWEWSLDIKKDWE